MKEIEIKVLDVDKEKIISKLESIGAKKVFDGKLASIKFDFDDGRISKNDELLRIVNSGNETVLTFKGKPENSEFKVREEIEFKLSNDPNLIKILNLIGIKEKSFHEKFRTSYVFKDIRFELDSYPGLPTYLEIEASDEKRVKDGLDLLGLDITQTTKKTAAQILTEHGIEKQNIKFVEE